MTTASRTRDVESAPSFAGRVRGRAAALDLVLTGSLRRRLGRWAALGAASSLAVVYCAGHVGGLYASQVSGSWFGLLAVRNPSPTGRAAMSLLLVGCLLLLVGLWSVVVHASVRGALTARAVAWLSAAWAAPFALGPPVGSRDIYSYAAQGEMLVRGINPYVHGPRALGASAWVTGVDPRWRGTPSPYGPLSLWLQSWSARLSPHSVLGALIWLRLLALLGLAALVWLAVTLATPRPRGVVIALLALNPVVLLHVVSGAHLEAVMVALLLGGLLLRRHGVAVAGMVLTTLAGAVKAPALLAVPVLLVVDVVATTGRRRAWVALRDVGVAAVTLGAASLLIPHGWGWIRALKTPTEAPSSATPAVVTAQAGHTVLGWLGVDVSQRSLMPVTGALFAALALALLVRLLLTVQRRDPLRTVGFGLLMLSLFGPVTHPWYLLWGFACLAPQAAGGAVRTRALMLVLSGFAALLELPSSRGSIDYALLVAASVIASALAVVVTAWPHWPEPPRLRAAGDAPQG